MALKNSRSWHCWATEEQKDGSWLSYAHLRTKSRFPLSFLYAVAGEVATTRVEETLFMMRLTPDKINLQGPFSGFQRDHLWETFLHPAHYGEFLLGRLKQWVILNHQISGAHLKVM